MAYFLIKEGPVKNGTVLAKRKQHNPIILKHAHLVHCMSRPIRRHEDKWNSSTPVITIIEEGITKQNINI